MHDVDSLARPLGSGGEGVPVEPPPARLPRERAGNGRWAALAGFAIVGSTGILLTTSLPEVHGSAEHAWRDRDHADELEVPITDGPPASAAIYAIKIHGLPSLGRSDAKVTLVAVTDYECANCDVTRSIVMGLRGSYGDDLRIVWKPYTRSPRSLPAAAGACAAALQGEIERYDAAIWRAGPERLPNAGNPECLSELAGCGEVARTARDAGLDGGRFAMAMKRCAAVVTASQHELQALQVGGQTFFVNGRMVDPWGIESAGTFHNLIDVELTKARRRIASGTTQARYYQQWVLDIGQSER